jgi:hypothetical protein
MSTASFFRRFMTRLLLLSAAVILGACNGITAPCDSSERAGIQLVIVDSVTQTAVLVDSVAVSATDGAYSDSVKFTNVRPDPVTYVTLALERAGVYDITVLATGYHPWQRDDVRVTAGRCHVNTVSLPVPLQRAGE